MLLGRVSFGMSVSYKVLREFPRCKSARFTKADPEKSLVLIALAPILNLEGITLVLYNYKSN